MVDSTRAASAVWDIPSGLLLLNKKVYDKLVKRVQEEKIAANYEFLKSFAIFSRVDNETVMSFARILVLRRYGSD